jgi:hypothetical protein
MFPAQNLVTFFTLGFGDIKLLALYYSKIEYLKSAHVLGVIAGRKLSIRY